ncbi:MAG: methyltransferase domain-containing protein [Planctomycetes bacterium]|nr:methyltransferase domain-containing protein [Planctomycetota bacterium]
MPRADIAGGAAASLRNPWSDADVERHWDAVAADYVRENDRVRDAHAQRFDVAVARLDLFPGARVLNVSSRDAEAEDHVRRAFPDVDMIHAEISQGLIDVARGLRPRAAQRKIRTYSSLPFDDGAFDRILSLETLEHVADPPAFLSELHRVARAGATLVLSCPPATSELAYRAYTALFGGHGEGPHRFLASRAVRRLLASTGWQVTWHRGTLLVPLGPLWLRRLGERLIDRFPHGLIGELGIRQFYVATRA